MSSGPVVPMVWEGLNVVKTGRVMLGETNPKDSAPGTIRGDFSIQVQILSQVLEDLLVKVSILPKPRLGAIFVTVLTQSSLLTKKLLFGSRKMISFHGPLLKSVGSTKIN